MMRRAAAVSVFGGLLLGLVVVALQTFEPVIGSGKIPRPMSVGRDELADCSAPSSDEPGDEHPARES